MPPAYAGNASPSHVTAFKPLLHFNGPCPEADVLLRETCPLTAPEQERDRKLHYLKLARTPCFPRSDGEPTPRALAYFTQIDPHAATLALKY